jgi:hypothetical protein
LANTLRVFSRWTIPLFLAAGKRDQIVELPLIG